jgi:glycogen operon protein
LIRTSLRYWVDVMHVDGFRFDLASVLARDEKGEPMPLPPVLWEIETDPLLAGTKLIAEAWDAAGLYQVGSFIGDSWQEWNGRFRDDIRHFLKGDSGMVPRAAMRLIGSPDIYGHEDREPEQSVNFITCHDGFTLADLVSYNHKHNHANGEGNRDGSDDHSSWNCGVEGPSDDPEVNSLRQKQIRNFLVILILSIGTPMLTMGDEMCRTQQGNNNAYCQDSDLSWLDWELLQRHSEIHRFTRELIVHRFTSDVMIDARPLNLNDLLCENRIEWHGVDVDQPDWGDDSRSLAITISNRTGRARFHLMINAYWESLRFALPVPDGQAQGWKRWIDTSLASPHDIVKWSHAPILEDRFYRLAPRSIAVLFVLLPDQDASAVNGDAATCGSR